MVRNYSVAIGVFFQNSLLQTACVIPDEIVCKKYAQHNLCAHFYADVCPLLIRPCSRVLAVLIWSGQR